MADTIIIIGIAFLIILVLAGIIWMQPVDLGLLKDASAQNAAYDRETIRSLHEKLSEALKNDNRDPETGQYVPAVAKSQAKP